ncbi:lipopolysaccharide kinase InaA family protein [Methylophaga sp.]|uniref:lipopolysaccharide kinase InaA family protein n=1 Tax=Methylophaga sp. TaxID=2024840 RepID=UPI0027253F80|nr:lipopolysaccharide kinase InaA family protein [Methylophaga sp.]MDO8826446.1 lipopolysaccharide kinase InaA family protein [Methylophaga sp.]
MAIFNKKTSAFINRVYWSSRKALSFERIWSLPKNWFDTPNEARGGWSGVTRTEFDTRKGTTKVFVKRQQNYYSRTWRHPFKGIPTFQKELENIQQLKKLKIPTLNPLYFGKQDDRAVLITKALDNYTSLDKLDPTQLTQQKRRQLIRKLAKLTRKLHRSHYVHNCFYPKHVFVKLNKKGKWKIRLIDLEKLRWRFSSKLAMKRDLSSFNRHADDRWTLKDRLYFFKAYLQVETLSAKDKKLWRKLTPRKRSTQ